MFTDSILFAWMKTNDKSIQIKRVIEDRETQKQINQLFSEASDRLISEKEPVLFDGKYTPQPDDDDYLYIDNFSLPAEIVSAINNPQGLDELEPVDGNLPEIKALFVGQHDRINGVDTYTAAFQKVKSEQYISAAKLHLLYSGNTFSADNRVGISVGKQIDCLYRDGRLSFASYYYAKQIFELSKYYRVATKDDVQKFVDDAIISMDGGDDFAKAANSWELRKIASIMDSGILKKYSASRIKSLAKQTGFDLAINGKKIVIPTDKKERRIVLGFLDEEVYKGAFSDTVYQTNSKRKAK